MARAPAKTVITQLASYGLSPATIATIFDIDVDKVRTAVTDLPVDVAVRDDDDLRVGVRRVAWRVIEETLLMLDEGSPVVKQRMVTNLFAKMMGLLAEESGGDLSELRDGITKMIAEMDVAGTVDVAQPDADEDNPDQ
tara:strand:+ start:1807 stop:2220 length:414 start_codon:yes stop_codon:yes gene_type:complete